ncbi:MAG: Asp-tRNA(Asn)/Glu-tRNA(Gln) amidotransferase subunit GatC [Alphaproteobacteria bacterium]|nr:Asp-tRNA(Asn)/Glu-tRNA(Gln) amidotransferase subunit GatC [Alphaproteobacteria bacterium]
MAIDNNTVRQIAFLAKLKVEPDKLEETKEEFNKILAWVEELREVNTDNVEPLVSVNNESLTLREDKISAGHNAKEILANAPAQEFGYFVVPKVVE